MFSKKITKKKKKKKKAHQNVCVCVFVCVCFYCYTYVDRDILTSHLSRADIFACVDVCVSLVRCVFEIVFFFLTL